MSFDLTGVTDLTDDPEAPWELIYTLKGEWIAVQLPQIADSKKGSDRPV